MYVIGTAGHVDHGKTSLIKALTGIDADRLPEEKQRHMTIDIGFAYITLPTVGTVSIVDVPGHERFIRNMVTGAWGIDIGLLVIAADDGWMKQTDDHVKVLSILGIPAMVVALTKVDSIEQQTLPQVLSNIDAMLATTPYGQAPVIPCSSATKPPFAAKPTSKFSSSRMNIRARTRRSKCSRGCVRPSKRMARSLPAMLPASTMAPPPW